MNDFLQVLEGTDDPDVLLRAARWVIRSGHRGSEARQVVSMACEEFGLETVYMDGELFTVHAGAGRPEITLERRVDTVILMQDGQMIEIDEWHVKTLREALYALAPRDFGPND